MAWWIPMAIGAAGSLITAGSQNKQNANQRAWSQYNATMQYNTDVGNIKAQTAIAGMNAAMQMAAGKANAKIALATAEINSETTRMIAAYNNQLITATSLYNDSLYEQELSLMWDAMDLDLELMANERAVERGGIEAAQSASGTVMGQGSNEDVIVNQMTQEAMDATVVRHRADIEAKRIGDARAQSLWTAQNEVMHTWFMGEMEALTLTSNARMQAAGAMANASISAAGTLATAGIAEKAGMMSAQNSLSSGMWGAQLGYDQNKNTIQTNLVRGLFGAAGAGASSYFAQKPTTYTPIGGGNPSSGKYGGLGYGHGLSVPGSSLT